MPMTPITTTAKLNEQTGMVLAYYGYDQSQTKPADLKATLGPDWAGIDTLSALTTPTLVSSLGADYNLQRNNSGTVENSFSVYINPRDKQIGFSFKGSDAISNWISDFANGGASEFAKIEFQVEVDGSLIVREAANECAFDIGRAA